MSIFETIGSGWVIFTSAMAHVVILVGAYKHFRMTQHLAERGAIEQRRDVIEAFKVRETIGRG